MMKSILRASTGLQAIALLGAGTAAGFIAATPAAAQDYTSGAIQGTVTDSAGHGVAGATVTLRSIAQNQVRNLVTNGAGNFTAAGLTPGEYAITVNAPGFKAYDDVLTVQAAQSSSVTVGLLSTTTSSEIVVTGSRLRQVTTQATTGLNVDVTSVTKNAPVGHSITALTLLAPTAQRGVAGFGDVPSVGGSSVAENAYYINGLNITNPDTYVGSARVPFYFYKNVDVQTGGYPAEFGRATGAVINATTKQGTNDPFIAAHFDWTPSWLQSHSPNLGAADNPYDIGKLNEADHKQLAIEAGGAILPDHLFVYGLIEPQRNTWEFASATAATFTRIKSNDPFWGAKVDGYITPTQHAEFTIFDTRETQIRTNYDFTPNSTYTGGVIASTPINGGSAKQVYGGLNWVARYTGDVTDWLTLSGAYGISKDRNDFLPANTSAYYASDIRSGVAVRVSQGQTFTGVETNHTKRRFYRGDADIRFTAAGQHHVRVGFDNEDLSMFHVSQRSGELPVRYRYYNSYVLLEYARFGGNVSGNDWALYAEDSWNTPLDGLTLNFGIRDDIFKQNNLVGEQTLRLDNNWGPRVAFTYAPPGSPWKAFGSYGRYFIPPAMNLSFRGRDTYFREAFAYPTGIDPTNDASFATFIDPITGLPTMPLGPAINAFGKSDCPAGVDISGAPGHPVSLPGTCAIYGAGIQNPALAKVVPGTKATYEDEFILGGRYRANSLLDFGIHGVYRKLGRVSEDTDFGPQLAAYWCDKASGHYDAARCKFYNNNSTYMIWNVNSPGSLVVNDWVSAMNGEVMPVTLTKGLNFPTPKRSYKALVFDFNRADDGRWLAHGSVTWSKLKGSTEGTVKSDAGNTAQDDAGSTQDFDYLGLSDYGYGYLPNDHRWQFKLFGGVHFGPATIGANIFVQSPMHGSCLGYHPYYPLGEVTDYSTFYGAGSHFCGTGALNADGNYEASQPSPRGTGWKSDWMKQIDLSFRYNIPLGPTDARRIVLRADVFNVFNSHAILQRNAEHEIGHLFNGQSGCTGAADECYIPNPLYGTPIVYQTPRYVRLGADIYWGGSRPLPPAPEPVVAPPPPVEAPATQTCADGSVILATATCPAPVAPPPPAAPERG